MRKGLLMRMIAVAFIVAAGAGCASSKSAEAPPPDAQSSAAVEGEFTVNALADAAIPKGECGMILWALETDRPAPIFRLVANKGGELVLDGDPVALSIVDTAGASGFGVFEDQVLAGPGVKATVKVRFGLGFDGGSYLERGLLTVESANGWRSVIPAAGIAGCRAK